MKIIRMGCLMAGIVICLAARAQDAASMPAGEPPRAKVHAKAVFAENAYQLNTTEADLPVMIVELKLGEDVQAALKVKFAQHKTATEEWETTHGASLAEAQKALAAARADDDRPALKEAAAKLSQERKGLADLVFRQQRDILSVLAAEQRPQWVACQVRSQMISRVALAVLTEEQSAKIAALAADATKDILAAATPADEMALVAKLHDSILQDVLTEQQRSDLQNTGKIRAKKGAKVNKHE